MYRENVLLICTKHYKIRKVSGLNMFVSVLVSDLLVEGILSGTACIKLILSFQYLT